jgi:Mn2+/Fe2+ NRAMP family transporter
MEKLLLIAFSIGLLLLFMSGISLMIEPKHKRQKHVVGIIISLLILIVSSCFIYFGIQS